MKVHGVLGAILFWVIEGVWAGQEVMRGRESVQEAAMNVKRLVHTSLTGTLASTFAENDTRTPEWPYAILEYHAPCLPPPHLLFLLFPESVSTQNIRHSPESKASYTLSQPVDGVRSPISRARVAFMGNMTFLPDLSPSELQEYKDCYRRYHPDAFWFPGDRAHPWDAMWARFTPRDIYYVGGFGDTHYIGHIPVSMYAEAGEPVGED